MELKTHIYKTQVVQETHLNDLAFVLNNHPEVHRWYIDLEDIDRVLKVETANLSENAVLELVQGKSIFCEVLLD